jgi:hypothetical protein
VEASCRLVVVADFCDSHCQAIMCKNPSIKASWLCVLFVVSIRVDTSDSILIPTVFTFLSHLQGLGL